MTNKILKEKLKDRPDFNKIRKLQQKLDMATKVKITYEDKDGQKKDLTKNFFGKEYIDKYISEKGISVINIEYL